MAESPEVVVEVVGWDGIDPLPELPLFHSTAEDSFSGSLYVFGEIAIFWLEGWRAFMRYHGGNDEAPVQKAPVRARFRSFLVRFYGENWEAMVLSEYGEVLLFELRAILAGWLGPNDGAEGRVCSSRRQLATSCLPGADEVPGRGRGLLCLT